MKFVFLLILFIFSIQNNLAQKNKDSIVQYISQKIDSMPTGFAISIALIKNGKTEHLGFIKKEDQLFMLDLKDSLFEIGSLTKVFTSTVLANEVLGGRIKLNSFVNNAFPFKFNNKIKLTYKSLANHTSGMFRLPSNILPFLINKPSNPYSEYTYDLFDLYLKEELQLEDKSISKYSYSNLGAGLLAYSLSKKLNLDFESLLKKDIFEKFKLEHTSYDLSTSFVGLGADENGVENWSFNALKGAGGLVSSTADLSKFIATQFDENNKELALTRLETSSISEKMSIGLAWHILNPNTENEKFWHNGATGGFTSSISFRTSNETGVVILTNLSPIHLKSKLIDELCFEVLDFLR